VPDVCSAWLVQQGRSAELEQIQQAAFPRQALLPPPHLLAAAGGGAAVDGVSFAFALQQQLAAAASQFNAAGAPQPQLRYW